MNQYRPKQFEEPSLFFKTRHSKKTNLATDEAKSSKAFYARRWNPRKFNQVKLTPLGAWIVSVDYSGITSIELMSA